MQAITADTAIAYITHDDRPNIISIKPVTLARSDRELIPVTDL